MRHDSRRMKRMARNHKKTPGMNLTSLMDVFTILVFFLLTNSASDEALQNPKVITLPASVVETKPKETVVILVTPENILIQGKVVADTPDVVNRQANIIEEIKNELELQRSRTLVTDEEELPEVNILADRRAQFSLLKKIMSSCTSAGYAKISLAVIQKSSQGQ
ncbi:MAG: biopolymer transporter ExbD [Gammaproteobacteria bacterium]|nr:biopolymer transporter ExbD [Gammaproteobacteria bacterium]MDH5628754.1 biopolymer transporter ExbD [Gammaproteobacteria bacterium]